MKLIVGLGNPGSKYEGTRHNVGFDVVDEYARRRGLTFGSCPADALLARERGPDARVILAKPLTFMNLSGGAVGTLSRYYRVDPADILVVVDDANLPLGRLRVRPEGSDGGHNGLRSVIEEFGTQEFPRLRVGVGRGGLGRELVGHVLSRFEDDERGKIEELVTRAADAAEVFVEEDILTVMNRFNASDQSDSDPETD